jgi:hypothetical protein
MDSVLSSMVGEGSNFLELELRQALRCLHYVTQMSLITRDTEFRDVLFLDTQSLAETMVLSVELMCLLANVSSARLGGA